MNLTQRTGTSANLSFNYRPCFMVVLDVDCAVVEACQIQVGHAATLRMTRIFGQDFANHAKIKPIPKRVWTTVLVCAIGPGGTSFNLCIQLEQLSKVKVKQRRIADDVADLITGIARLRKPGNPKRGIF